MSRIVQLGSGQSGSTLLGMGLALSPEVTMLGEISELHRVDPAVHECTCGVTFGACPVWGTMFREGWHERPFDAQLLRRAMTRAREIDGTQHCVDSCKGYEAVDVERSFELEDARFLYLVRHPCGYVYSQLHSGYELNYALDAWIDEQTRLLALLDGLAGCDALALPPKRAPAPAGAAWLLVRYEDLAREPGPELGRIGAWLGIRGPSGERDGPWDFLQAPWGPRQHVLSGAAWRLSGRPVVSEDTRWRHALASREARKIVAACRPLLDRLGYAE